MTDDDFMAELRSVFGDAFTGRGIDDGHVRRGIVTTPHGRDSVLHFRGLWQFMGCEHTYLRDAVRAATEQQQERVLAAREMADWLGGLPCRAGREEG